MATISSLVVELSLQAQNFNNQIKDAQKEAKEFEKTIKPTKQLLTEMGTAMTAAGGAIVAGLVAATVATANYLDNLNDLRQKTGVAANDLARLGFAAEQSGSSLDGIATGMRFLARNMEDAASGSKKQEEAFKALGVSVTDANGKLRSTNEVFLDIADRFANMKDGAAKTAIAMDVFGKSGAELIPTLNAGRDGLAAMGDESERLRGHLDDASAAAGDEFNDRLNELKTSMEGVGMAVGTALLPPLTKFLESATDAVVKVREWAQEHPGLTQGLLAVGAAITGAGGILAGTAAWLAILPALKVALGVIAGILAGPAGVVVAIGLAITAVIAFRNQLAGGLLGLAAQVNKSLGQLVGGFAKVAEWAGLKGLAGGLKTASTWLENSANGMWDMREALVAGEPVIIGNTEAVKKAQEATKTYSFALGENTKKADEMREKTSKLREEMDAVSRKMEFAGQQAFFKHSADDVRELHAELKKTNDQSITAILENFRIAQERTTAWKNAVKDAHEETMDLLEYNTKKTVDGIIDAHKDSVEAAKEASKKQDEAYKDLYNSVKSTASNTFLKIFEDGKFQFSALADTVKGIFATLANEILSTMVANFLTPFVNKITGALSGLIDKIPGVGGILSGGAGAASSAVGAAGSAAGSVGSSAGSAANGLTGGLLGFAGGVLGGVISAIGSARQEGTLNAIEENTRYSRGMIKDLIEQIMWPIHDWTKWIAEQMTTLGYDLIPTIGYWGEILERAGWLQTNEIVGAIKNIQVTVVGGGAGSEVVTSAPSAGTTAARRFLFNNPFYPQGSYANGTDYVPRTGIYQLHKGEAVIPADDNKRMNIVVNVGTWLGDRSGIDELVRKISDAVQHGGTRLIASEVRR
jgi:hypothetical protein